MPVQFFLDEHDRLVRWPSKRRRADQLAALTTLLAHFEAQRTYTEAEVNAVIQTGSTLEDYAMLRRELVEAGLLESTPDGATYWKAGGRPPISGS